MADIVPRRGDDQEATVGEGSTFPAAFGISQWFRPGRSGVENRGDLVRQVCGPECFTGRENAERGFHLTMGERRSAVKELVPRRERPWRSAEDRDVDFNDLFVISRGMKRTRGGDAGPTVLGSIRESTVDFQADRPEERVLRLFHVAIEIREMDDSSEVGIAEFHTAGGEKVCHALEGTDLAGPSATRPPRGG